MTPLLAGLDVVVPDLHFFDDAALRLLPSAGHFSPLEAPDEFAAEILAAAGLTGHGRE